MGAARIRPLLIAAAAVALFAIEGRRRLRSRTREGRVVRTARNLAIAAGAALATNLIEMPLARAIARRDDNQSIVRLAMEIVLLDYGLYLWHVLTHKVPLLWRFHMVHHVDLDLDASTALRFHFGEMLLSAPWRVAQVRITGASLRAFEWWQTLLFLSILFHHSNVRLPLAFERVLRFLIVTPRLHGIHHHRELSCTDSNWSSGLAVWDLLHGTYRWSEKDETDPGVPGYDRAEQVGLARCISLPFSDAPRGFERPPILSASRLRSERD